ncbi:hypothetical protein [Sphingomonas sp.]|uniref:hypothetical protein n=1 Tax=Sphingomonas sp. TaxID=28214 RepID=UPI003CC5D832
MTREPPAGAIPTSRLLAGILLHFCPPAYLLSCLAAALLVRPVVTAWAGAPARMLWTALWFFPTFLLATAVAGGVGALIDRRRPRAPDPVAVSRAQVSDARARLGGIADGCLTRALDRIDAARWDHADARYRQIAADLDAAARTFAAAAGSAIPDRRKTVLALAATSIERLAAALDTLAVERQRLDEGDARTVATYLDARYGEAPSSALDSAG